MPFDSNGNFSLPDGTIVQVGDKVLPSQHNPAMTDLAAGLSSVVPRDGRAGMVGPLPMGGFPVQNVGASTNVADAATVAQLVPIGTILDYVGISAPPTWMFPFGQAVSRTTYAALFAVIGTTYGAGDGGTTFNLPDLRGFVTAGRDNMGGTDAERLSAVFGAAARTLGGVLGAASHILTLAQMPKHNHGGATGPGGSHNHTYIGPEATDGKYQNGSQSGSRSSQTTSTAPNHAHSITINGDDEAHPNAQPTLIMNKIIRVSY